MTRMSRDGLIAYRALCKTRIDEGVNVNDWRRELDRIETLLR